MAVKKFRKNQPYVVVQIVEDDDRVILNSAGFMVNQRVTPLRNGTRSECDEAAAAARQSLTRNPVPGVTITIDVMTTEEAADAVRGVTA